MLLFDRMFSRLAALLLLCFSSLILSGCCGCLNPNYSVDNVEGRLITSEVYENYPSAAWADNNHAVRLEGANFGAY
jgi:hypothetical protein